MDIQSAIEEYLSTLKLHPFPALVLDGKIKYTPFKLEFLTKDCQNNHHIISLLTRWRKKHETWFQMQFPVTYRRTEQWYDKKVIDTSDRLLFLISVGNVYFGHIGLFRFDYKNQTCDIDNIVRGRKGYPGLMESAIEVMMKWGRERLQIKAYTLSTTSDNTRALSLYNRLGFHETKRVPLVYRKTVDGSEWIEQKNYVGEIQRYTVYMKTLK